MEKYLQNTEHCYCTIHSDTNYNTKIIYRHTHTHTPLKKSILRVFWSLYHHVFGTQSIFIIIIINKFQFGWFRFQIKKCQPNQKSIDQWYIT